MKKGMFLASAYTKVLVVIAFLAVIFIFYLLFAAEPERQFDVKGQTGEIESAIMLNNILSSPVEVEAMEIEISDLMQLAYYDCPRYCAALEDKLGILLSLAEHEYRLGKETECMANYMIDMYVGSPSLMPLGQYGNHGNYLSGYVRSREYYEPNQRQYCTTSKKVLHENPRLFTHKKNIQLEGGDELTVELTISHRLI